MKKENRVNGIICADIYLLIFFYMIILVSFNIQTLLGDLYEHDFNSSWCVFMGYLAPVFLNALYWAFVNQVIIK